jgi:hypothetical protein
MAQVVQGSRWGRGGDGRHTAARTILDCMDARNVLTSQNTPPYPMPARRDRTTDQKVGGFESLRARSISAGQGPFSRL